MNTSFLAAVINKSRSRKKIRFSITCFVAILVMSLSSFGAKVSSAPLPVQINVNFNAPLTDEPPPLFGYGGGIWHVPRVLPWVNSEILELPRQGTYRAALAWEVLAASKDLNDLKQRLKYYRLNDFLQQVQSRGAQVIIVVDAMPRWLAKNKSDEKLADGPAWAKSPPENYLGWVEVMQEVVTHFNSVLGLNAWYEVWNEPDWSWLGTLDEYFQFYKASVQGALAADRKAKIGGPSISDWSATGTVQSPYEYGKGFFIQKWLAYAANTSLPEQQLTRLPVDFITWHGFYREPVSHYRRVVPHMRSWLKKAGYPEVTPLVVDEWNIAAAPPYPEGDFNRSYVGAAYVASSLISMADAGLDRQVFQMLVDPGAAGYSAGTFTGFGLERPSFHAFSLFSRLKGRRVDSNNDQDWLSSVAYATEKKLYLLVAGFVPTPYMRLRAQFESLVIDQPQILNVLKPIKQDTLFKFYENGKIPTGVNDDQAESFLQTSRQAMVGFNHARLQWRDGLDVGISVAGKKINACEVKRYRLDKKNTVEATKVDAAHEQLQKIAKDSLARAVSDLAKKGIAQSYIDSFIRDMGSLFALRENSEPIDMTVRGELVAARDSVYRDYSKALAVAKNRTHSDQVSVETFSLDDGPIKFKMAPYTVELFEFCLK